MGLKDLCKLRIGPRVGAGRIDDDRNVAVTRKWISLLNIAL